MKTVPAESGIGSTRIAVCSWSLRPASPRELLDRLKQLQIPSVQLALSPMIQDSVLWADAIDELRAGGIWVASGMMAMAGEDYSTLGSIAKTGGLRPDHTWFANRAHAEQVARLASRCGVQLVSFHAGFIHEDLRSPEHGKMVDRLRTIAEIFAHYDVDLALETGQESAATLETLLTELDCPRVGVNFDPANMILYGMGEPIDALRRLMHRVRQAHIKDALPTRIAGTWGREVPVGRGAVDWDAFFDIALAIQPPVQFVIEREGRGTNRDADIAAARDLIAHHLTPRRSSPPIDDSIM